MALIVVSVGKRVCHGAVWNKKGQRVRYKGKKTHWEAYFFKNGRFCSKKIGIASIPFWKARIQRFLKYKCEECKLKFRSNKPECPRCGEPSRRLKK